MYPNRLFFSILLPAYKAKYLKECIDSVISQTYDNFELIIVDDASPEDLYSIVDQFADCRIRYYRNDVNFGAINVVDNWNKCLSFAKGDYVICLGDDDKLLPYCLEEYSYLIKKYPNMGVYHGWTEIIDDNSQFIDITSLRSEYESVFSMIWHRWNGRQQYIGDFLFDAKVLNSIGGFYKLPLAWGSDDITSILCAKNKGIANTQRIVFQYRRNPETISSSANDKTKADALIMEKCFFDSFLMDKPDDQTDLKFWHCIIRNEKSYFYQRLFSTAVNDVANSKCCSFLFWFKNRKRYGFSISNILHVGLIAIKSYVTQIRH